MSHQMSPANNEAFGNKSINRLSDHTQRFIKQNMEDMEREEDIF